MEITEKLLNAIEKNDIGYLFSYNIKKKMNIFIATKDNKDVQYIYEAIQNKLEKCGVDNLPLLIYDVKNVSEKKYYSVIDILIEKNAFSLILSICSAALTQDVTGLMYDKLTRYIKKLNFSKVFVRSYLAS
jgi:hypothetical protein